MIKEMITKAELVIFDLDGVLVDTAKYHFMAWKKLADDYGWKFSIEDNEHLKGVSRLEALDIIIKLNNQSIAAWEKEEIANKKNQYYKSLLLNLNPSHLFEGVEEVIEALKVMGKKIALGSASKNAKTILEYLEIQECFDCIVDGNQIDYSKPNPQVFEISAEKLGVPKEKCLVIEDAYAGIEAAINAGMMSIGIGDREVLNKADLVYSCFKVFAETF